MNDIVSLVKDVIKNDSLKEMMAFMSEEIKKDREHELRVMQLILNSSNFTEHNEHNAMAGNGLYHNNRTLYQPHFTEDLLTEGFPAHTSVISNFQRSTDGYFIVPSGSTANTPTSSPKSYKNL